MTTYNRLHGRIRHLISFRAHRARLLAVPELTAQVGGGCASLDEGNPVYHSQPLGTALGHSGRGVETQQQCAGRTAAEGLRSGGRDEPASGTRRQCAGGADAEGLGWLSEA
ncbi:hypothetical protein CYMTET_4922 [Cymbomonas tetramitiformis]|uniref:Uncharacterized protein n=1 Tax=Cymbomonas tetramitiformis TaxID=36881 RepID=A0AAE0H0E8_9CHLO|nr:hypothetical protein CYMTET_4922 [Cymbomonas tetramitiformis]